MADGVADVERGQTVLPARFGPVLQVDGRGDQEDDFQERLAEEQREAGTRHP
nr:hypothetical protein [Streptomyces himalayensis]